MTKSSTEIWVEYKKMNTNGNETIEHKDNAEAAASPEAYAGSMAAGEVAPPVAKLTKQDFVSGQEVRWCPGCGDY